MTWSRHKRGALVLVAMLGASVPAERAAAAVSLASTPTTSASFNGKVLAIAVVGDRIYVGGSFTSVRATDGTTHTRNRLAALDATTGEPTSWNPDADRDVRALVASEDGGEIFAGGDFTSVGGRSVARLARISSGGSVSSWNPGASSTVRALALAGDLLYAGGSFSTLGGVSVSRLAAIGTSSGEVHPGFLPRPSSGVRSLALSPDRSLLYVGGSFSSIGGSSRQRLAAVSLDSGLATAFSPNPDWPVYGVAVSSDGRRVFAAGAGSGGKVASWSSSGSRRWERSLDGDANAIAATDHAVYAGGHFHQAAGQDRRRLAAFDPATGALDPWNPGADSTSGVYALRAGAEQLYVGGAFTQIGGVTQPRFARFPGTP